MQPVKVRPRAVARVAAGLSTNAHYARVSKSSRVRCVASSVQHGLNVWVVSSKAVCGTLMYVLTFDIEHMKKVLQSIYRAPWIQTKIQTRKNSPSVIVAANKDEIRTFLKLTMISNDFLKREIQKELILMEICDRIKYFLSKLF